MPIQTLALVANVLSIMGSLFVISLFGFKTIKSWKKKKFSKHNHLLFVFGFNGLVLNVGGIVFNLVDHRTSRAVCLFQAFHVQFWNLTNVFIMSSINLNILIDLVCWKIQRKAKKRYELICTLAFHFFQWGLPLLVSGIMLIDHRSIQNEGAWCWIDKSKVYSRFLLFYGWMIFLYGFNVVLLFAVVFIMCRRTSKKNKNRIKTITQVSARILIYSVIFLFCWVFGIIVRFINLFDPDFYNEPLWAIHTFVSVSLMFWIGISSIYAESLIPALYDLIREKFCAKKPRRRSRTIRFKVEADDEYELLNEKFELMESDKETEESVDSEDSEHNFMYSPPDMRNTEVEEEL